MNKNNLNVITARYQLYNSLMTVIHIMMHILFCKQTLKIRNIIFHSVSLNFILLNKISQYYSCHFGNQLPRDQKAISYTHACEIDRWSCYLRETAKMTIWFMWSNGQESQRRYYIMTQQMCLFGKQKQHNESQTSVLKCFTKDCTFSLFSKLFEICKIRTTPGRWHLGSLSSQWKR